MNILVVGCGSIGRRHCGNLLKRSDVNSVILCTKVESCAGLFDDPRVSVIRSLEYLPDRQIDLALICNETSRHAGTALQLLERGIPLFLEKPVSHSLKDAQLIADAQNRTGVKVFIAYNLRFVAVLPLIREKIAAHAIGKPYFSRIEVGQYLPQWRSTIDYRKCYSAARARGGGVDLDLSHEIDYMRYLFGDPETQSVMKSKVSDLEIDSYDLFEGMYRYHDGFVCSVHMDYLQGAARRALRIVAESGEIMCDFIARELVITGRNGVERLTDASLFDVASSYEKELDHFITAVTSGTEPSITLHDGIRALQLIEV